jgi:prepilin signal peptidase PulO-like enzyme (type II secretory pathway)
VSWQYLALEVGMGGLFLAAFYRACGWAWWGDLPAACTVGWARFAAFLFILALVFVYDARYGEIPDSFSVTGIALGFVLNFAYAPGEWWRFILAAAVGAAFFGVQHVLGRGRWVGTGDIVLGAMIGAMVGWPDVLPALFVAYLIGLVFVVAFLTTGKKKMGDTIPLGPFLAAGTAAVLLTPVRTLLYGHW